jgi:hypothetical protein
MIRVPIQDVGPKGRSAQGEGAKELYGLGRPIQSEKGDAGIALGTQANIHGTRAVQDDPR